MRILFDHNAPRQLRRHLVGHDVDAAGERGHRESVRRVVPRSEGMAGRGCPQPRSGTPQALARHEGKE